MQPCIFLCKAAIIVCGVFLVCCHSSGMDLTTKSGTTYRNCSIHRGDKTGIYIKLGDSLKFIPLSDVPDDIAERYSANLKTKLGDIYYDYSVVRVRNDALKIKHKWGVSWVNKAVLPDFLLEKYKSTQVPAKAPPGNRGNVARNSGSRNSGDIVRNDGVARDNNTRRFDLASPKRIVQSDSAESWSKTVTVSGSGINEQTALEDAFRTAVREAVGAYVITRSTLKEGDFSEEIYINADAVISHHEIIKKSVSDGIIELVVRATVVNNNFGKYLKRGKSNDITTTDVTNLLNKRNSLNVAIKSVPYIFDEFLKNSCFIEK